MKYGTAVAAFICLISSQANAEEDLFKKYNHLTLAALDKASSQNCDAYDEALSYWVKADQAQTEHIKSAIAEFERDYDKASARARANPTFQRGVLEVKDGIEDELKSIINWHNVRVDILQDANEKGCKVKPLPNPPFRLPNPPPR